MTKVIFRKYPSGEIIALFPETPGSSTQWHLCDSYAHMGQHGSADPLGVIRDTKLAKPEEYADLLEELKSIGYDDLVVKTRNSTAMRTKLYNNWSKIKYDQ